jgi:hypothetical protein
MARTSQKTLGPTPKFSIPPAIDGQGCQIIFGHNMSTRLMLMQFTAAADRLIFTPEEARDVASKLQNYADLAEGKKAM